MRKLYIISILSILVFSSHYLYAGDGKCMKCHRDMFDGYSLEDNFRGDIYRVLEHPCSPLSKVKEECFNTEMLMVKTQNILDELHQEERIEISNLQKNLDIWKYKYEELLDSKIHSLQDFKDSNALIRFNLQKVYKEAADYQVKLQKRIAFGVMVCCSLLLVIFFIQGFKNSAGPGHPPKKSDHSVEKIAGCLLVLFLIAQPLFSQVETSVESTQNQSYLDRLSSMIQPLENVSLRVSEMAYLSGLMMENNDTDKAFLLLVEGRKLWNKSQKKLSENVLPMYLKPDKTGWVESDEGRYEKIGAGLDGICAPWALRELVLSEIEFGLDGIDEKIDELIQKLGFVSEKYTSYSQLSELAGLLARKNIDKALLITEKIDDPFFKVRAFASIAVKVNTEESLSYAKRALDISKTIKDPRFRTEITLKIYNDLGHVLPKLENLGWLGIESGFDIKGSPEVKAIWKSRIVELLAGYDIKKAKEVADKIESSYPEPFVASYLTLYEHGEEINLSNLKAVALKIDDDQLRDGLLFRIAIYLAKNDTKSAHEVVVEIENDFYKDHALSKILVQEYLDSPDETSDNFGLVKDHYVSSKMKVDIAKKLIDMNNMEKASEMLVSAGSDAKKSSATKPLIDIALMWANVDITKSLEEVRALKDIDAKWNSLVDLSDLANERDPELSDILLQEAFNTLNSAPKISQEEKALGTFLISTRLSPDKKDLKGELEEKSVRLLIGE